MNPADSEEERFRALLAEHWDQIVAQLDEEGRVRMRELLAEADPAELRAELEDLLLEVLPASHPLVLLMRNRYMFHSGVLDPAVEQAASARLRELLVGRLQAPSIAALPVGAPDSEPDPSAGRAAPEPDSVIEVSAPEPEDEEPWQWLYRRTRHRLLQLPWRSPENAWAHSAEGRLIRLAGPEGPQLPVFQFDPDGRPWLEVLEVNAMLDADRDPWGVACWWVDPHAALDRPPCELLGTDQASWLLPLARRMEED